MRSASFYRNSLKLFSAGILTAGFGFFNAAQAVPQLVNQLLVPGNLTDLGGGSTPNENRLGGFGSDLAYDRVNNEWYGLVDRGPGGGLISYETRVQKFSLDFNQTTGAISNFTLKDTIKFTDASGNAFNGLNPLLLNGDKAALGNSFDPEGLVRAKNGHFFVADEYGPSVKEFDASGKFVRNFTTPANLIATQPDGPDAGTDPDLNYVDGRPTTTKGRQDNRGFEGLTASPDGTKLYAILQDPLLDDGATATNGRNSRNVRIVEFDAASGLATKQFAYQLESLADINARIPGTADDFAATQQGRSIGVSSITALNDHEFLVIERDNRGVGVDTAVNTLPVGTKRIYKIDITGATDVSAISFFGSLALPGGVTPVGKSLYMDVQAALFLQGLPIYEKFEGLFLGPLLDDGTYAMLLATDNDFSVTQTGAGVQSDVCTNGVLYNEVAFGGTCATGYNLIASALYSVRTNFYPLPEPMTGALLLSGLGGIFWTRHRK